MAEIFTPVDVENRLRELSNQIAQGVNVQDRCLRAYNQASRKFDAAWAHAILNATGTVDEKKQHSVLATMQELAELHEAEAQNKYAINRARALTDELHALQSIGASVRETYRAAGVA